VQKVRLGLAASDSLVQQLSFAFQRDARFPAIVNFRLDIAVVFSVIAASLICVKKNSFRILQK
jgi:hypothetical protein